MFYQRYRGGAWPLAAFLILLFADLRTLSNGLAFELEFGAHKCIHEDLPPDTDVRGEFQVASGVGEMTLDLFVTDSKGKVYFHDKGLNVQRFSFRSGNFAPQQTQRYIFCVLHQMHPEEVRTPHVKRRVSFSIVLQNKKTAKGIEKLATNQNVETVRQKFDELGDELNALIAKLDDIRSREQEITVIGTDTTSTILKLSVIAMSITALTGLLNYYQLQSFFKRKKLM